MINIGNLIMEVEENLKELSNEQRKELRENFTYNLKTKFQYGKLNEKLLFSMNVEDFSNFSYYTGMEYEKDNVYFRLEYEGQLYIAYNEDCGRALDLLDIIESLEEEELEDE